MSFLVILTAYLYFHSPAERHGRKYAPTTESNEPAQPATLLPESRANGEPSEQAAEPPLPAKAEEDRAGLVSSGDESAEKAMEKSRTGDYEGALRLFRDVAENDKSVLVKIGVLYAQLGDYDNALTFLEKAAAHDAGDFVARKYLARIYYKRDNLEMSLLHAEKALALRSDTELSALLKRIERELRAQKGFRDEASQHFKILFDGYEHGGISRKIIGILEDAHQYVGNELYYFPPDPVTVVLYTDKAFRDTTRTPGWVEGVYDGKIRVPVKGSEGQEALLKKVLYHEYTHAVVHSMTSNCPLWINEGLAEYFSQQHSPVKPAKKVGQLIPLTSLERSFSWLSGDNIGIAYAESYSVVSYIVEKYGLHRMKEFLYSLSIGMDTNQAFSSAFGVGYREFIAEWGKS